MQPHSCTATQVLGMWVRDEGNFQSNSDTGGLQLIAAYREATSHLVVRNCYYTDKQGSYDMSTEYAGEY